MSEPGAEIPDDVMERAARAICDQNDAWWEDAGPLDRDVYLDYVRAALPILTPAIERNALKNVLDEMILDATAAQLFLCTYDRDGDYGIETETLADWLNFYADEHLPTEDEEAT